MSVETSTGVETTAKPNKWLEVRKDVDFPLEGSCLIICNHPPLLRMAKATLALSKLRSDVYIVANVAWGIIAEKCFKQNTISFTQRPLPEDARWIDRTSRKAATLVSKVIKNDGKELAPERIPEASVDILSSNQVLFYIPSGAKRNQKGQEMWRKGISEILIGLAHRNQDTAIIFMYISPHMTDRPKGILFSSTTLSTLIQDNLITGIDLDDKEGLNKTAMQLQKHYQEECIQSNLGSAGEFLDI